VKLSNESNLKTEFMNSARGHMIATSVGASATGRGGNFLIVDDLINPEQANSDLLRSSSIRWFNETFSTRLDDKKSGRIVAIEQRTHSLDLTGHLLAEMGWHHIALPAIAEKKTLIVFPRSLREVLREEGDILWPTHEGKPELEAARQRLGSFAYQSQYQQAPIAREGNLIKAEWLTPTYRSIPPHFSSLVLSVDTAFKTGTANDYSAIVVVGSLQSPRDGHLPGRYVLDAWRGKVEFADLKRRVVEMYRAWRPHQVLIEDAASGQSLIQELRSGTPLPIKRVRVDRDKRSRVAAISPILEARRLLLPESSWWRDDFVTELISFPAGVHDDWVDALTMALEHLREGFDLEEMMRVQKVLRARQLVAEGYSVEEAAAEVQVPVADVHDSLDRIPLSRRYTGRFPSPNGEQTKLPECLKCGRIPDPGEQAIATAGVTTFHEKCPTPHGPPRK
jgi:predicted phage terminase large subunit-like protein